MFVAQNSSKMLNRMHTKPHPPAWSLYSLLCCTQDFQINDRIKMDSNSYDREQNIYIYLFLIMYRLLAKSRGRCTSLYLLMGVV